MRFIIPLLFVFTSVLHGQLFIGNAVMIGAGGVAEIKQAPAVVTNPSDTAIYVNGNATFSVSATGTKLTYQWQVSTDSINWSNMSNGGKYSGSTTTTLTITGETSSYKHYRCVVSGNKLPSDTSASALFAVISQEGLYYKNYAVSQGNVITQKNIIAIDRYILSAISSATRSKIVRMNVFPKGAWNCPLYRSTVYVPDTVQSNRVPDSAAYFTTGGTAYWNTVTGTRSWNSTDQCLRITASTTHQVSIQRASGIYTIGKTYKISFKYRASGYTNKINIIQAGVTVNVENNQTPNCSSSWQTFTTYCSSIYNTYTGFTAASNLTSGQYIEYDSIMFQEYTNLLGAHVDVSAGSVSITDADITGNGLKGKSNAYISTLIAPQTNTQLSQNSTCLAFGIGEHRDADEYIGALSLTNYWKFKPCHNGYAIGSLNTATSDTLYSGITDSRGLYFINRNGAASSQLYYNTNAVDTTLRTSTGEPVNIGCYIMADHNGSAALKIYTGTSTGYIFAQGLTPTEILEIMSCWNNYNRACGRFFFL